MYNNKLYGEDFYQNKNIPNLKIEDLYFSSYTYGKVKKYGRITDLYSLLDRSENQIRRIKSFSYKAVDEVKDRLDKMNLVLYPGEELISKTENESIIKILETNSFPRLIPIFKALGIETVFDLLNINKENIIYIINNNTSSEKSAKAFKTRLFNILQKNGYYFEEEIKQRNEQRIIRAEMTYKEFDFSIYSNHKTEEDNELKKLKTKIYAERNKYNRPLKTQKELQELILLKEQLLNSLDSQLQEMEKKKVLSK